MGDFNREDVEAMIVVMNETARSEKIPTKLFSRHVARVRHEEVKAGFCPIYAWTGNPISGERFLRTRHFPVDTWT
jgi:hypothetical protein